MLAQAGHTARVVAAYRILRIALYVLSVVCAVLLFVDGPGYYSPRSYNTAWDLGHVATFFVWTCAILSGPSRLVRLPLVKQLYIAVGLSLLVGLCIEVMQTMLGRSFSATDILGDLTGSVLALVFVSPSRGGLSAAFRRSLQVVATVLLLVQLAPLARALTDEMIARKQFPVLSDFETPFELQRWSGTANLTIAHDVSRSGAASLKAILPAERYATVMFRYFPSDWSNCKALRISLFNTSPNPLLLTFLVHDTNHIWDDTFHDDVFEETFALTNGWNDLTIALEDIRLAPKGRAIDLGRIRAIGISATHLLTSQVIYIDDIYLTK